MRNRKDDQSSEEEAQRRFEAALRGARLVGQKPRFEMKLGNPRGKMAASPMTGKMIAPAANQVS